MKFDAMHFIG